MTKPQCQTFGRGGVGTIIEISCAECSERRLLPASDLRTLIRQMKRFRDRHADLHAGKHRAAKVRL